MNRKNLLPGTFRYFSMALLLVMTVSACATQSTETPVKDSDKGHTVSLPPFTGIHNEGVVSIHFTQGSPQSVSVKDAPDNKLKLCVKNGTLYIESDLTEQTVRRKLKGKSASGIVRNVRDDGDGVSYEKDPDLAQIWLTLPTLKSIDNSELLRLEAAKLSGKNLLLDNSGQLSFSVDAIDVDKFDVQNTGVNNLQGNLKAHEADFENSGVENDDLHIAADLLDVDNSGVCNANVKFTGKRFEITNSGVGNMNYQVDCEQLEADCTGVGNVTLSGTADKTEFKSSGVANLNTSELNNY